MRDQVTAGNHTIYLRITEETSEEDPRYFDLPLIIRVEEDVRPGRIFIEQITGQTPFLPNDEHEIEKIGEKLRGMMPWISAGKMVDKDRN